jgi:hypothetical protein
MLHTMNRLKMFKNVCKSEQEVGIRMGVATKSIND